MWMKPDRCLEERALRNKERNEPNNKRSYALRNKKRDNKRLLGPTNNSLTMLPPYSSIKGFPDRSP